MACLAGPRLEHLPQGKNGTTRLRNSDLGRNIVAPARQSWDLHDSASTASTPSIRSYIHPHPKEQILRCLHYYTTLAQNTLTRDTAKACALWCCLGLCAAIHSSVTSPPAQSPLSAESRTSSTQSLATASDSGFASVETKARHCLSLGDLEMEHAVTNLVCGLTGILTSHLVDLEDTTCSLPAGVGHEFDHTLTQMELGRHETVDVMLLASKTSSQLLNLIQNQYGTSGLSAVSYWELCLRLVAAAVAKDSITVESLTSELQSTTPPPSLIEPALSSLLPHLSRGRQIERVPFPASEHDSKYSHVHSRLVRQTRSRAASLMSHSSLRSFSSVRSLGHLSPKSPASLSLSHDFRFSDSPTDELSPSGSFVTGSPETSRGSFDSLSQILHANPRRRGAARWATISGDEYASTAPASPLRPPPPTLSRSSSGNSAPLRSSESILFSGNTSPRPSAKGKENAQFGLRPGAGGVSSRTGTRFMMTDSPTLSPSGLGHGKAFPKLDPVLAALERGSKLKSKSLCANCATKGSNYPCCPRCGESWCSRECRVAANNGGRHVCKRSASTSSE